MFLVLYDFVCVIGMVGVKVFGVVKYGEWIFVFLEYLGVVVFWSCVSDVVFSDVILFG